MNTVYLQILFILAGNVVSCCVTMYLIRWKKRENRPRELEMEIERLRKELETELGNLSKAVVVLRGQVKYIEGRLNGHAWKQ